MADQHIEALRALFRGIAFEAGAKWDEQNEAEVTRAIRALEANIADRVADQIARRIVGAAARKIDPNARTNTTPRPAQQAPQPAPTQQTPQPAPAQMPPLQRINTGPTISNQAVPEEALRERYFTAAGRLQTFRTLRSRYLKTGEVPPEAQMLGFDLRDNQLDGKLYIAMREAHSAWTTRTKPLQEVAKETTQ